MDEGHLWYIRGVSKRILVIANKTWEAAPLLSAMFSPRCAPATLEPTQRIYDPELANARFRPRALFAVGGATVQVWCIEDLMDPRAGGSNTSEKARVLARLFRVAARRFGRTPDAVVAFGTAGIPASIPFNGCVTVGTQVFTSDPFDDLPEEQRVIVRRDGTLEPMWSHPLVGALLDSALPSNFLTSVPDTVRFAAEARFVPVPIRSATPLTVLSGNGFAAISTINVTNYDDYVWADPRSLERFREAARSEIGSQETTHGVIRIVAEAVLEAKPRFLYVSGITDSLGLFNMDVTPRAYAQNFAAAHNAGVALAWMLPELAGV